jgi:hypothetical protein
MHIPLILIKTLVSASILLLSAEKNLCFYGFYLIQLNFLDTFNYSVSKFQEANLINHFHKPIATHGPNLQIGIDLCEFNEKLYSSGDRFE